MPDQLAGEKILNTILFFILGKIEIIKKIKKIVKDLKLSFLSKNLKIIKIKISGMKVNPFGEKWERIEAKSEGSGRSDS